MKRILIIDDTAASLQRIMEPLEKTGFIVRAASSGAEALRVLQTETFDHIIVDVNMPEIDGFEFTRRFRLKDKDTPILMLTRMEAPPEYLPLALRAGVNKFISRSEYNLRDVLNAVDSRLNDAFTKQQDIYKKLI